MAAPGTVNIPIGSTETRFSPSPHFGAPVEKDRYCTKQTAVKFYIWATLLLAISVPALIASGSCHDRSCITEEVMALGIGIAFLIISILFFIIAITMCVRLRSRKPVVLYSQVISHTQTPYTQPSVSQYPVHQQ